MWRKRVAMLGLAAVIGAGGVFGALAQDAPTDTAPAETEYACPRIGNIWGRPVVRGFLNETGARGRDVRRGLRHGQTLEGAITAAGGDVEAARAGALARAEACLNTAVEDGRITQAQADDLLARMETRLDNRLATSPLERGIERQVTRGALGVAAQLTGLTPQEIRQELRDGATLAEVLQAHDANVNAFIDALAARAEARLNVAVVDGRITQAQADDLLAQFRDALSARLNGEAGAGAAV